MSYTIADEPKPSGLNHLAVQPIWPLFAFMFGGAYFSWIWSIVNGLAIGSPTFKKELTAIAISFLLSILYLYGFIYLTKDVEDNTTIVKYGRLGLFIIELACCYILYFLQSRTFELYRYYGGLVRNGFPIIFLAFIIGGKLQAFVLSFFISSLLG